MSIHLKRRRILKLTGCAAVLGIPAFASTRAAGNLVATHFGGPYAVLDKLVGKPFADAGLGAVRYEQELSTSALGKIQAGVATFDVAMMSRSSALRGANAGLFAPIAPADFPNLKDTIDGTLSGFGVSMVMDSISLAVNTKQVGAPINSWLDLWRPDLAGKIALPAAQVQMPAYVIAMLAQAMGGDYRDEKAVNAAFAKFAELKKSVRVFYGDPAQGLAMVERGEVAVAPIFSLRISSLLRTNGPVTRVVPKEGVIASPYDLVIVKKSSNVTLAKRYIDFVLSKDIQTALSTTLLSPPLNRGVTLPADVADKVLNDPSKLIFVDEKYIAAKQSEWLTRWERQIQA